MNNLLFLPIEIQIYKNNYTINKNSHPTFQGLWQTIELNDDEIKSYDINFITDQLPFQRITLAKYNTQPSSIPAHIDVQPEWTKSKEEYDHIISNEPAGYRIILIGKNDSLEIFDGSEWRKAILPEIPFAYVLNSTSCKHRVNNDPGRQTIYLRGWLNKIEHVKLLNKNLQKFQNYAIFKRG